jgi:hypothetical protein
MFFGSLQRPSRHQNLIAPIASSGGSAADTDYSNGGHCSSGSHHLQFAEADGRPNRSIWQVSAWLPSRPAVSTGRSRMRRAPGRHFLPPEKNKERFPGRHFQCFRMRSAYLAGWRWIRFPKLHTRVRFPSPAPTQQTSGKWALPGFLEGYLVNPQRTPYNGCTNLAPIRGGTLLRPRRT